MLSSIGYISWKGGPTGAASRLIVALLVDGGQTALDATRVGPRDRPIAEDRHLGVEARRWIVEEIDLCADADFVERFGDFGYSGW